MSERKPVADNYPVVLVQCVEDCYYFSLFAEIIKSIRANNYITVEQFVVRSLRPNSSKSIFSFLTSYLVYNYFTDNVWIKLYNSFCNKVAFRCGGSFSFSDIADMSKAYKIWKSISNKYNIDNIHIDGIKVGDLIYDSYLRFKAAPTVEIRDRYLLIVIWQCCRDIRSSRKYFTKFKPSLFITSYSTYVQHGSTVRMALDLNINVYSLGNYYEFAKKLTVNDYMHTRNHDRYKQEFLLLEDQENKKSQAEEKLRARTLGEIDSATSYMKKSAYEDIGEAVPDVEDALVIFLHDFFDAPHCYRWLAFPDFYEWVIHTIKLSIKNNLRLFIKPHPNEITASKNIVAEIKKQFPYVPFLSQNITNKQLSEAKIGCGVTVYGTVAHELAFLGVPVICCGDHAHISFKFCHTAHTVTEYDKYLTNYKYIEYDKEQMRNESLEFYYMQNMNYTASELELRDNITSFRSRVYSDNDLPEIVEYNMLLNNIIETKEYKNNIDNLIRTIRGK